ncbi:hypothetical protein ACFQY0_05945 [Haloferula chungangensis]|uniref:PEP-CTERM sorting domain-containing protein n=1 Tax=Haloferula chungangensis TaxID=1048331 RepID=A0ABW2L5D7_9BACT
MHTIHYLTAILGCSLAAGQLHASVLIQNGAFTTSLEGWNGSGSWSRYAIGNNGLVALQADNLAPFYSASGGSNTTESSISTLITGLIPNSHYEVSFSIGSVVGISEAGSTLLRFNPGGIQLLVDGVALAPVQMANEVQLLDPSTSSSHIYDDLAGTLGHLSLDFFTANDSITLSWRAVEGLASDPDNADVTLAIVLLDDVSLMRVPEPTTSALALVACLMTLTIRRRVPG